MTCNLGCSKKIIHKNQEVNHIKITPTIWASIYVSLSKIFNQPKIISRDTDIEPIPVTKYKQLLVNFAPTIGKLASVVTEIISILSLSNLT